MKFPTLNLIAKYTSACLKRCCSALFLTTALLISTNFTSAHAESSLTPFIAKYKVQNNYITGGTASLSLTQNEKESFSFVLQTKPTGLYKISGKGNIREQAELPTLKAPFESSSYRYTNKGDSHRDYYIEFDRANDKFQITQQEQTQSHPLPTATLDRLSLILFILNQLQQNTEFTNLEVNILKGAETQKIELTNHGTEEITTDLGKIETLRISRQRSGSDRQTIMWFARAQNEDLVIPARIDHLKSGKLNVRLTLTNFSVLD